MTRAVADLLWIASKVFDVSNGWLRRDASILAVSDLTSVAARIEARRRDP